MNVPSGLRSARRSVTERVDSGPVLAIAAGAFLASMSMNFWIPFLPLYLRELGVTSDADALMWVGVAATGQGIARLVAGPFWGVLSDRLGRKPMYIRALYAASLTTLIAVLATEPWHIAVALACQGFFSGFIPAAVALTSVTVPESRLSRSLGTVTAAQFLGVVVGPSAGALLAIGFGMWGAILASALLPAFAATMVLFVVPRDRVVPRQPKRTTQTRDGHSFLTLQFGIALLICFVILAASQMLRLMAPISIAGLTSEAVTAVVGVAFTLGGVASVLGVFAARRLERPSWIVWLITCGMAATAVAHVVLAWSPTAAVYVGLFALISFLQATLLPASNTLIAQNAPPGRRGTAFGIAASAQAIAFMVGPVSAALFAMSLSLGYLILAAVFGVVAMFTLVAMRAPKP